MDINLQNSVCLRAADASFIYNYPVEKLNQANVNINVRKDRAAGLGRFSKSHIEKSGLKNKALLEIVFALIGSPLFVYDDTETVA